jgi:hypothetical protein
MKLTDILQEIKLAEMPLKNVQTVGFDSHPRTGKERSHSFGDKRDRDLIRSPVNIKKLENLFKNMDNNFNFYFINKPGARKHAELGAVEDSFIKKEFGIDVNKIKDYDTDDTNVFFVGNTAAEKVPMTSWTVAHRLGHAIRKDHGFTMYTDFMESEFNRILNIRKRPSWEIGGQDEGKRKSRFFNQIGTMRSARNNKITRYFEFYYELFAQYLNSGEIKFNKVGSEEMQDDLDMLQRDAAFYLDDAMGTLYGKTFVM